MNDKHLWQKVTDHSHALSGLEAWSENSPIYGRTGGEHYTPGYSTTGRK